MPSYIDMDGHTRDMEAHRDAQPAHRPADRILQAMNDTNLLPGYDIDYNSRSYYRSRSKAAKANDLGAITRIKI